ncbi:MAG: hypothetical protein HEQ32_06515 [Vampirovibrio sp.]
MRIPYSFFFILGGLCLMGVLWSPRMLAETPASEALTRVQVAEKLLTHFHIKNAWTLTDVSPFRDVPTTSPQYALLETAWQYHLLNPDLEKKIRPNQVMTRQDAWRSMKGLLLTAHTIKDEYDRALLSEDPSFKTASTALQEDLVVLYEYYILDVFRDLPLEPEAYVSNAWLDSLLTQIPTAQSLLKTDAKRGVTKTPLRLIPALGEGFPLILTPQEAILGPTLKVGQTLFFRLEVPLYPPEADTIVEGSSVSGRVIKIQQQVDHPTISEITMQFTILRNGHSNVLWRLKARLNFLISTENEALLSDLGQGNEKETTEIKNYILPTTTFSSVTEPLPPQE